ncbi:MAG: efflux RND transporter periplasmic adaptor subunit [Leptospirales bacterium]
MSESAGQEGASPGHAPKGEFEDHESFRPEWKNEIDLTDVHLPKKVRAGILVVFALLIGGPVILFAYKWFNPPVPPRIPLPTVQVMAVRFRTLHHKVTVPAGVESFRKAVLYAHVPGYLKYLNVDKGDYVHKGQVLAYIQDPELYQNYLRTVADTRIADLTYHRIKRVWLAHPALISKERVQQKFAVYLKAVAEMRHEEALLSYKTIAAPFDGMITERFVDPGKLISQATEATATAQPIVTIEQVDTLRAYVWVPADLAPQIRRGQRVEVHLAGLSGRTFWGRVTRFDTAENPRTRTMRTEVDMSNPDFAIHPGMYGKFTFYLAKYPNSIVIPGAAIMARRDKPLSVMVVKDGKALELPIAVGIDNAKWVQVISGLSAGDRLVVAGKWHVRSGESVRAVPMKPVPFRPARQL